MKPRLASLCLLLALLLTGCGLPERSDALPPSPVSSPSAAPPETLTVSYIDVGQADCTLLECGGEYMLIDGGNVDDGQLVVSYLEQQGVEELAYVVCTHAHEDHVGGLAAVLAVYPTGAVLAPTATYASGCFDDFLYYADQQGLSVTVPAPGDQFFLGSGSTSASVTVLGPVKSYPDTNNTSLVINVSFGDTVFLFTGDMETEAEKDMLDYWDGRMDWKTDVLKVGHHGSSTSTGYRFLYETDPAYAIIFCGADNPYGHPHREVVSRLQDAEVPMFRTDVLGTVVAVSSGTEVTLTWANRNAHPENVTPEETVYIGNVKSRKLHLPSCDNLPKEKNQVLFDSYEAAIAAGYTPCGSCFG